MAHFELHYPDEGSPTQSWTPTYAPVTPGSEHDVDLNVISEVVADGTQYAYQVADAIHFWLQQFSAVTDSDKASFLTFCEAVVGKSFRMKAPTTLGTYETVVFDGPGGGFKFPWKSTSVGLWSVQMRFRSAVGSGS